MRRRHRAVVSPGRRSGSATVVAGVRDRRVDRGRRRASRPSSVGPGGDSHAGRRPDAGAIAAALAAVASSSATRHSRTRRPNRGSPRGAPGRLPGRPAAGPDGGYIVVYEFRDAGAAVDAGNELAGYLGTGNGRVPYPLDAQHVDPPGRHDADLLHVVAVDVAGPRLGEDRPRALDARDRLRPAALNPSVPHDASELVRQDRKPRSLRPSAIVSISSRGRVQADRCRGRVPAGPMPRSGSGGTDAAVEFLPDRCRGRVPAGPMPRSSPVPDRCRVESLAAGSGSQLAVAQRSIA